LNSARKTTRNWLFLAALFSFLTVVGSGSVAVGDLLVAPNPGAGTIAGQIAGPGQTLAGQLANLGKKALSRTQIDDLLRKLPTGRNRGIRTAGSESQLDELFEELSRGGIKINSSYPGISIRLPDGTIVRRRPYSSPQSGGPTIDIDFPGGGQTKIHIDPWPPTAN